MSKKRLTSAARFTRLALAQIEKLLAEGDGVARAYECLRCGCGLSSKGPGRNRKHCAKCRVAHLREYQGGYYERVTKPARAAERGEA